MRGKDSQGVWDGHVCTAVLKMDDQQVLHYSTGNSAQWYVVAWMGGDFAGNEYMYMSG